MREVFCELGSQILFFCSFNPFPRSFFEKIKLHSGWRSEKKNENDSHNRNKMLICC